MTMRKGPAVALGALGVAALIVLSARTGSDAAEVTDASAMEIVAEARRTDLDIQAEAPGQVEPVRVVEVKSKASGEVLDLHAETGDRIRDGELLVEIDPRDVRNALAQAEADLEVARVRARIAEEQRERAGKLLQGEVITEQEYESAELEAANAQAVLVRAETDLQLARERMNDVTIRAPITGTVIERPVEVGQIIASAVSNVSGGTTLLRMADLSEVQVRTLVDETDIGRIQPGQTARVEVESFPGRTFRGEVLKIEPQAVVEQNVTMFPVLIRLDNPERLLKPGMNAEVVVDIARRRDVVTIPNGAVVGVRDAVSVGAALGLSEETVRSALRGPESPAGADGELAQRCSELRQRMRDGGPGSTDDEDRALMRECRELFRGGRRAGGEQPGEPRPGVVFVQTSDGIEPRRITLGVSDWEHTEVGKGLEAGESVLLVSVARLQQEQKELTERIRQRAGGPFRGGS